MSIRLTGLTSGLDTESLVNQLVEAHQLQVENETKKQTKLEWKKEAWASLNTKLYSFYTGALSKFKSVSTYKTKKVTASDDSKVSFSASNNAVNGTHTLSVKQVASAAYLTGSRIDSGKYTSTSYSVVTDTSQKLSDLVDKNGYALNLDGASFKVNDTVVTVHADADATIDSVLEDMNTQLAGTGVTVGYDTKTGGFTFTNNTTPVTVADAYDPMPENYTLGEGVTTYTYDADTDTFTEYTGEIPPADGTTLYLKGVATTYHGTGSEVTITAMDENSAQVLGLSTEGKTIQPLSSENTANTYTGSMAIAQVKATTDTNVTSATKLTDLGIAEGTVFTLTIGGESHEITVEKNTTLSQFAKQLSDKGINANYDQNQGRFFLSSTDSGEEYDFTLTATAADGSASDAMDILGLSSDAGAVKVDAQDAIVTYNRAEFKQASNIFSLNGLNFTVTDVTYTEETDANGNTVLKDKPITLTVANDVDAVYNTIKDFINEYNAVIEEMNTLYNAKRVTDYEPLTSDEKEAMSDDDVEKWEKTIKDSLLRRDSTIGSLLTSMRTTLNKSIEVQQSDGTVKKYALSSFGINTGVYSENGKLHIYGDEDDSSYADETNKLMQALADNPEAVMKTLSGLGTEMYENLQKAMKSTTLSSALTFYNDIQYDNEISEYKEKISKLQEKLTAQEDRFYDQFSAMETALAKLQSQQNYISQLLGS